MTLRLDDVLHHEPEPVRKRRGWVTVVVAVLVVVLLSVTVLRLGGLDFDRFTTIALALTPYWAAYGLVVTFIALVARRRLLAFSALLLAVSLAFMMVPRYLADGESLPAGPRVRVMTANLWEGRADIATLVRLVRDARVDVLVLQEVTPQALVKLTEQTGLFNQAGTPGDGGSGSVIMSRLPLRQIALVDGTFLDQATAVVDTPGAVDIELVSVHAIPPVDNDLARQRWLSDLRALPGADPEGRPRVLAGDFNATLDHKPLLDVLDRGYADAAELAGEGMRPTWSTFPYGPPVTIDHVLLDKRLGAADVKVYDLPGSDHNALVAEIALPR